MHLWWLRVFHPFALPALILYLLVIYTISFILLKKCTAVFPSLCIFLIPLGMTSFEYIRTLGYLGFPYGIISYSQYRFLPFIQSVDITGHLGTSFLLFLCNSVIAHYLACYRFRKIPLINSRKGVFVNRFTVLGIVFALNLLYGSAKLDYIKIPPHISWFFTSFMPVDSAPRSEKELQPVTAALIQPWFDYNIPWNHQNRMLLYSKLTELTARAGLKNPDLIIWPETAIMTHYEHFLSRPYAPYANSYAAHFYRFFKTFFTKYPDTQILSGAQGIGFSNYPKVNFTAQKENVKSMKDAKTKGFESSAEKVLYYNSAILLCGADCIQDTYSKIMLVPFAEWFPYQKWFPRIARLLESAHASQFSQGQKLTVFNLRGFLFSVLICYEDCFAEICRRQTIQGSRCLIVLTNDAWSYSAVSEITHLAFSIFRAIENRRPVLRGTNAGVTAHVKKNGVIDSQLPLFTEDILYTEIQPSGSATLFTRYGERWILYGLFIYLIFASWAGVTLLLHHFKFDEYAK